MITNELITEFKNLLELEGIDITDYSDEDIELLLESKLSELTTYLQFDVTPTSHKEIVREFSDDMYEVDYYPLLNIQSLKINDKTLTGDEYYLDEEKGIIYLKTTLNGIFIIEYCSGVSDSFFSSKIKPLIFDMSKYALVNNFNTGGAMSSVKEGDVQVNYDITSSLGGLIQTRINNLKNSYQCRVKVI